MSERPVPDGFERGSVAASEAAGRRSTVLAMLKSGELDLETAVALAAADPAVARLQLVRAIRAVPSWNTPDATALLARVGAPDQARLSWLTHRQRGAATARLLAEVALGPGRRPRLPPQWPLFGTADWLEDGSR